MLSVVIPTRNRAAPLRSVLDSLTQQRAFEGDFEVLVVDNGSTDDTRVVVEEFRQKLRELRYFYDDTPGLHIGRHVGLREARGEVLVYADDDIQATPTWLEAIADCFRNPDVALVGGNNYPKFEVPPPPWLVRLWDTPNRRIQGQAIPALSILKLADGRRKFSPYLVWGCNFSVRRRVLIEAGGFHPDGMPQELVRFRGDGETHVSQHIVRTGLTCLFDSQASVYHCVSKERMSPDYFRRRAFNQGVSDSFSALRLNRDRRGAAAGSFIQNSKSAVHSGMQSLANLITLDRELRELKSTEMGAYREGYAFHQQAYRREADVQNWVHKANYF